MNDHTRYYHVAVDWSRGYTAGRFHLSRGYHGDLLDQEEKARIANIAVDQDLTVCHLDISTLSI